MKSKTPLLSVIVPTRNEEKLLPECLRALKSQDTTIPFEIIIVDTKSTDRTVQIAKSFGVRVIKENMLGKVYAFRRGATSARANILCFTEADCIVPSHWITTIHSHFLDHPRTISISGIYTFRNSNVIQQFFTTLIHNIGNTLHKCWFQHHNLRASNFAIRRSVYEKSGGFSTSMHELYDAELSQRIAPYGDIQYLQRLQIKTSDRRIKGRLFEYIKELLPAIYSLLYNRQILTQTYEAIR